MSNEIMENTKKLGGSMLSEFFGLVKFLISLILTGGLVVALLILFILLQLEIVHF